MPKIRSGEFTYFSIRNKAGKQGTAKKKPVCTGLNDTNRWRMTMHDVRMVFEVSLGGADGARTRNLRRDRPTL
jgi:hypothetical protein